MRHDEEQQPFKTTNPPIITRLMIVIQNWKQTPSSWSARVSLKIHMAIPAYQTPQRQREQCCSQSKAHNAASHSAMLRTVQCSSTLQSATSHSARQLHTTQCSFAQCNEASQCNTLAFSRSHSLGTSFRTA